MWIAKETAHGDNFRESVGTRELTVVVPHEDGLALSGLVLADSVEQLPSAPEEQGPFTFGNVNVVLDAAALDYPARPGEYGWDGSAGTIFWIDPAAGLVTVLMTQNAPANPDSLRQRFKTLVQGSLID